MREKEEDHTKAMEMLNSTLREMKGELVEIDDMSLTGSKKEMADNMHDIYSEITDLVERYQVSKHHDDLNHVFKQIEVLKPAFVLNYNEILN